MKRLWLLLVIVISLQPIHAQKVKQAPSVEQCRANQQLWMAKVKEKYGMADVSFKELDRWNREMGDCKAVDPEFITRYVNTSDEICNGLRNRLLLFMLRHGLMGKFIAEDAQGKGRVEYLPPSQQ